MINKSNDFGFHEVSSQLAKRRIITSRAQNAEQSKLQMENVAEHTEWVKTTIAANGGGDVCTSR